MQVTRRGWAIGGLTGLLAVAAVVLGHPLFVGGVAGLISWVLVQQARFVWAVGRLYEHLHVTQTFARDRVAVDEAVPTTVTATVSDGVPRPLQVTITPGVPLGATATEVAPLTLSATTDEATTTGAVTSPVAGRVQFETPTVTVTDQAGLFHTTFPAPSLSPPTVDVVPPRPRALHIGEGGDRTTAIFGEHRTGDEGDGIEPASVREYTPGDARRRIDWKATARSDSLYVRTFTEQTGYETALFIDHRTAMQTGTVGETKLDYARQVALAVVDQAASHGDAVGLYAVGDDGVTARHPPRATMEGYSTLRTELHDLTPTYSKRATASRDSPPAAHTTGGDTATATVGGATVTPGDARRASASLRGENSQFATALAPFFTTAETYVHRVATDPLFSAVRAYLTTSGDTGHHRHPDRTVILTDDTNRAELLEAVKIARGHSEDILVFLTPTVLFEPTGLADLDAAYDRYVDFETFRQRLGQLEQVTAFELAPGDRLATLQRTNSTEVSPR